jgi:hypothetical protein
MLIEALKRIRRQGGVPHCMMEPVCTLKPPKQEGKQRVKKPMK